MVARVGQRMKEAAVVGEEQKSFTVGVQTPHRTQHRAAGQVNQFRNKASRVNVLPRAHNAARLVERNVVALRGRAHRTIVKGHRVRRQVNFGA